MLYRRIVFPPPDMAPSTLSRSDVAGTGRSLPSFLRLSFLPVDGDAGGRSDGTSVPVDRAARVPAGPSPEACLSLAAWGDMRYLEGVDNPRRSAFFSYLGLDPAALRGTELYHTRRILLEGRNGMELAGPDPAEAGPAASHDGILLRDPAKAACITVADCMPIWLLDRHSGSFGVLHSGWKGTGILAVAVRSLAEEFGSRPESISVILGPAIGACCYAVPTGRAEAFAREFGPEAVREEGGRIRLDLRAANLALALRLGLGALLSVEACTFCDPRLGSFRREGPEAFTRMAAVAAFLPAGSPPGCLVVPAPTL